MYRTDDPAADYNRYDAKREKALRKYPKCAWCGERITDDHFYDFGVEYVHEDCLADYCDENFKVNTDNYID